MFVLGSQWLTAVTHKVVDQLTSYTDETALQVLTCRMNKLFQQRHVELGVGDDISVGMYLGWGGVMTSWILLFDLRHCFDDAIQGLQTWLGGEVGRGRWG